MDPINRAWITREKGRHELSLLNKKFMFNISENYFSFRILRLKKKAEGGIYCNYNK